MTKNKLIEHHTKYKELHGVDETAWIAKGEHKRLHVQLRKDKKCNIPVDDLRKISKSAHYRTKKNKEKQEKYRNSKAGKETKSKYNKSEKGKETYRKYRNENVQHIYFSEAPFKNTELYENIYYNKKTGAVTYCAGFRGIHGHKIPVIDI